MNVLGGDPAIVGQSLTLDRESCLVAGVMPPTFAFYPEATELWTLITPQSDFVRQPDQPMAQVGVFGRLAPGVTIASAQAELTNLHRLLHARIDPDRQALVPVVYPLREELTWLAGRNLRTSLLLLFAAVVALLVVACLNVAGVLVGRGLTRERELAVRLALGSTRGGLVRLVLAESLLFAAIGAACGLLVAAGALRIMEQLRPIELPPGTRLALDWPVLTFTVAATAMTALLFGLWPAWRASRTEVQAILQSAGTRGVSSGRVGFATLVVAEVTLSVLVAAGAALLIQSVTRFGAAPLGFNPDRVVMQRLALPADPADRYAAPEPRLQFYEPLLARVHAQPGVEAAAISSSIPVSIGSTPLTVDGRAATADALRYDTAEQAVTASYFRVLDIPLHAGRLFDDRDRADTLPVAIVNDALAQEYFPGENPLGRRIRLGTLQERNRNSLGPTQSVRLEGCALAAGQCEANPWLTIVGVIGTEQRSSVFQEMAWIGGAVVFRPLSQSTPTRAVLLARAGSIDPITLLPALQRDIATIDPMVPIGDAGLLRDELDKRLAYPRFRAALLGLFAALALFLAVLGLYGVLSHAVAQRRREIAIRMALGAARADVLRLIGWQGLRLATIGTALGLVAAWSSSRFVATLLYGVRPTDVLSLAGAGFVVLAASLLATAIPARRAARLDPMVALKRE